MFLGMLLPWRIALQARHKALRSVDLAWCTFLRYHSGRISSVTRNAIEPAFWMFSQETGKQALPMPLHCVPILSKCSNILTPRAELPRLLCPDDSTVGAKLPGVLDCPHGLAEDKTCSSVLKKRRKKMRKHKYRKWRRRTRFIRRALKNG